MALIFSTAFLTCQLCLLRQRVIHIQNDKGQVISWRFFMARNNRNYVLTKTWISKLLNKHKHWNENVFFLMDLKHQLRPLPFFHYIRYFTTYDRLHLYFARTYGSTVVNPIASQRENFGFKPWARRVLSVFSLGRYPQGSLALKTCTKTRVDERVCEGDCGITNGNEPMVQSRLANLHVLCVH